MARVTLPLVAAGAGLLADRRARRAAALAHAHARLEADLPERVRAATVANLLARAAPAPHPVRTPVTDLIGARLAPGDRALVEAALEGSPRDLHEMSDTASRSRLLLNFAAFYGLEDVLGRAGLSAAMPPEDVHAMARGPVAAGGDAYVADLVVSALEDAGFALPRAGTVLDFGASSGRVLRMLAAARPELECVGCDPNEGAIAWASEHLPMARFFVSPLRPPLELAEGSVAFAYAVSIWSHFAAKSALAWLREMHRVLAPGAPLLITTHGLACLSTLLRRGDISEHTAASAADAMVRGGHHFVDIFGEAGDWGVRDPEWGNAYLTLDWLMERTDGDWAVRGLWSGGMDETQDVIVLERR